MAYKLKTSNHFEYLVIDRRGNLVVLINIEKRVAHTLTFWEKLRLLFWIG